ncbi:hypothetical protein V6N13_004917 [Hibiscus sabdariffa]
MIEELLDTSSTGMEQGVVARLVLFWFLLLMRWSTLSDSAVGLDKGITCSVVAGLVIVAVTGPEAANEKHGLLAGSTHILSNFDEWLVVQHDGPLSENDDVAVDERLVSVFGEKTKEYNVAVKSGSERAIVGKHGHAWMVVGDVNKVEVAKLLVRCLLIEEVSVAVVKVAALNVVELLVMMFINGGR